ncbi:beta-1,3-galactosyltransferase 1-like [Mytilus galloprovincialis]|uniref:beta-1,3-galactosyltransferase 1-like n=1 Tax=Mytilus galloprovincialis TaxID=29158 RepID=UPI003F7C4B28
MTELDNNRSKSSVGYFLLVFVTLVLMASLSLYAITSGHFNKRRTMVERNTEKSYMHMVVNTQTGTIIDQDQTYAINGFNQSILKGSTLKCFGHDFEILINEHTLCEKSDDIDILILISSSQNQFNERQAIRKSWGSECNRNDTAIKCLFVIGNDRLTSGVSTKDSGLQEESTLYKDIVQIDYIDSYGNLTYKTVFSISWAARYCSSAKYVMKTDTDMYVNTNLLPFITKKAPNTFIGGYCWGPSTPHRNRNSKWYVSFKGYKENKFPPMCSGTGYIISMDLVLTILQTSEYIPFFYLEDVYIAMCLKKMRVTPIYLLGFNNIKPRFNPCFYKNDIITSHGVKPRELITFWNQIKSCNVSIIPENVYKPRPLLRVN